MIETTISDFIEQQFPQIYREEGPLFIEFMKQYYVWMETDSSSPIYQARHHISNHDIDTTVDNFLIYFKEKYLKGIQINTATNTTQLIKNATDLYRAKGTENAIKLFFDLIFSAESEVYYPGKDVFRLSSSEWTIPQYLEVISVPINRLFVGRPITGVKSGATAFVEKLVRRKVKGNYIEVLYISSIQGTFQTGEKIRFTNPVGEEDYEDYPTIIGSLTSLDVIDGGSNFSKGEKVKLESRSGSEGRALVSELQSITGIVNFDLIDGGWGYSPDSNVNISDLVLRLSNVHIVDTSNNSLDGKILNIVQPMANVQWYANTTTFNVGDLVYNYYANGAPIGVNRILSQELGGSNTTQYFLLNTISGNNYMDPSAPLYYNSSNTESFTVQNAGWSSNTATGISVGSISSNVVVYCTGNSQSFSTGDFAYQVKNGVSYANSRVKSVTNISTNIFSIEVDELEGLFLTNQPLISNSTGKSVSITSLSYDIGIRGVQGSFRTDSGNYIIDTANTSQWNATISSTTFGNGANTGFDSDLLYSEVVNLNTNFLRDHIDVLEQENWLNSASYGASLNDSNLNNMTLADAFQFETKTLGKIARLKNESPGVGYSYAPFIEVINDLIAPMDKKDFIIRYTSTTGVFTTGEEITQTINGAKGIVKFANTSEVHIQRLTFEDRWTVGNSANSYLMVGTSSGHSAYPSEVTYDIDGVAGKNAEISTQVTSSNTSVLSLKIVDSGFGFKDGDSVTYSSMDDSHSGLARSSVVTSGIGSGFYRTSAGFLSDNKYLYDGDYYQDFSYEIQSPVSVTRYSDMLKSVLHVSGTKVFSSILRNINIDSQGELMGSSVSQS
jgi:hypothetical protein